MSWCDSGNVRGSISLYDRVFFGVSLAFLWRFLVAGCRRGLLDARDHEQVACERVFALNLAVKAHEMAVSATKYAQLVMFAWHAPASMQWALSGHLFLVHDKMRDA